jgi:uncharacterized protein (TIGR02246 family)
MTADRSESERRIWEQVMKVAMAFRTLDPEGLGAVYAEDADWTNAFGTTLTGREQIVDHLRRLFADERFAAGELVGEPQARLRWVGEDVAVVKTYLERRGQRTVEGGELPIRRNHSIKVLQRQGGEWLIVSDLYMDARDERTLTPEGSAE